MLYRLLSSDRPQGWTQSQTQPQLSLNLMDHLE